MLYNTYSESDLESETNFQQPNMANGSGKVMPNSGNFVRNNSIKNSNQQQQQKNTLTAPSARRRASDCSSYYGMMESGGADNISFYGGQQFAGNQQKRGSFSGTNGMRRSRSNKSSLSSSSSGDVSSGTGSTCSGDSTSTSSGQPNLPYPGFVEYSFKYLGQDARPRNWCLQLITNPYLFQPTRRSFGESFFLKVVKADHSVFGLKSGQIS